MREVKMVLSVLLDDNSNATDEQVMSMVRADMRQQVGNPTRVRPLIRLEDFKIEEGNTEVSECYLTIKLFGVQLWDWGGDRDICWRHARAAQEKLYRLFVENLGK